MIVVTEHSEKKLCDMLNKISQTHEKYRAVHISHISKFGDNREEQETNLSNFIYILNPILENNDVHIYLAYDGDIIFLGQTLSANDYKVIRHHLTEQYALPDDYAQFFEKGNNWYHFTLLAQEKLDIITMHEQQKKRAAIQEQKRRLREAAMSMTFSNELITSIAKRRQNSQTISVVFAEDDPFSRKLVKTSLDQHYHVFAEENGKHAIEAYVHKAPDVMFLDIDLPDVTGHDILGKIMEYDPNAYIIMLSGNGDRDNVMKAIQLGAKGFVTKPFTKEKLIQYIEMAPTFHKRSMPCVSS